MLLVTRGEGEIHVSLIVATAGGIGFTVLLGTSLMTLAFLSAGAGTTMPLPNFTRRMTRNEQPRTRADPPGDARAERHQRQRPHLRRLGLEPDGHRGGNRRVAPGAGPVATVAIEAMEFIAPIHLRDLISVYAEVERVGRTSMAVRIEVVAERDLGATRSR